MSMLPFLDHVEKCSVCRAMPRMPCAVGYDLFQRGAERLTRLADPRRAKA
jgi:hypothetical protein